MFWGRIRHSRQDPFEFTTSLPEGIRSAALQSVHTPLKENLHKGFAVAFTLEFRIGFFFIDDFSLEVVNPGFDISLWHEYTYPFIYLASLLRACEEFLIQISEAILDGQRISIRHNRQAHREEGTLAPVRSHLDRVLLSNVLFAGPPEANFSPDIRTRHTALDEVMSGENLLLPVFTQNHHGHLTPAHEAILAL